MGIDGQRNLHRDEARERADLLDVQSYDVDLDLTGLGRAGGERFDSVTEVRFGCRRPGASSFLELDGELLAGDLDGRPLTQTGNRIALPDLRADNTVRIRARCRTTCTGQGLHRSVDPADEEVYLYAQSFLDDAQRIFACFDQPDLKAVVRLSVTAPPGWRVLGNTRATGQDGRHVFTPTQPISTYLVTLAAGPWHGEQVWHGGVQLGVWCRRSLAAHLDAEELLGLTRDCLDAQQRVFGRPFPFGDAYDQVFVPEFNAGAMENPGMVTFSEQMFVFRSRVTQGRRRLRAQVLAHEMAHMWFGDLVTMRWWDDLWLNESFAEFLGVHTVESALVPAGWPYSGAWADFAVGRKAWGYRADQLPTTHPVAGDVIDNRSALLNFDGISYAKGASALRQLAAWLGEQVFFDGVRRYLDRHAFGNTGLADLLAALEQASGRDLQEWARTWLRTAGVPVLRVQDGAVLQEPPDTDPVLRAHRVGVGLYDEVDGALRLRKRLEVDVAGSRTPVPGLDRDRLAGAALVLPNDGDLTFAKVRLDGRSLRSVLSGVGTLADPLARAVCWGALWDAARDGELGAGELVAAVLRGLPAERDPEVVQTLLQRARTAAVAFHPDGTPLLAALHRHCRQALAAQEPGGDLQLVLAQAVADTAAGDGSDGSDELLAWLDRERAPAGLAVDVELRWHLLGRLAALGAVDAGRIGAELDRDRTAAGELHAAQALSALPSPGGKQATWEELTGAGPLTNARAKALADGFWQPGQDDLLRPYVARYADDVLRLWEHRPPELATAVGRRLFPATLVEQAVLDDTAVLLEQDLPTGLRRLLLEERDDLARALRARSAAGARD